MGNATEGGIVLVRTLVVWLVLLVLAILNGAGREALLTPHLGPAVAHVISTITLCALILATSWLTVSWIAPSTTRDALAAGGTWLAMTFAFEFLAGHYLFGKPWPVLVADYNLLRGRVWVLVPLVTLLAPLWAWRLRNR
jgi:hypothetical protein